MFIERSDELLEVIIGTTHSEEYNATLTGHAFTTLRLSRENRVRKPPRLPH